MHTETTAMLTLILLRHAKSSWAQGGQMDFDRPLNERGYNDVGKIAQRMALRGIQLQRIISSSALRAAETAQGMARHLELPPESLGFEQRLYLAEPADLMSVLREQDAMATTVMLVGHNPGITDFSNRVADGHVDNMPTCSFAEIQFDAIGWEDVEWGSGTLVHFDWPKNLVGESEDN
jgi:phosphohistidine phosphatase